jgi:type 1 fimbria pilin
MKKLIALFAILVAMTSFSFAENSNSATATVNVWNPISVTITVGDFHGNILTNGTVTIPFTLTVLADNNPWAVYNGNNSITATHGTVSVSAFSTVSGTGNSTPETVNVKYINDGTAGAQTVTATYEAQYTNL